MERKTLFNGTGGRIVLGVILGVFTFFILSYSITGQLRLERTVAAAGDALEKVREAASKEGKLVWFESSPEDQYAKIEAAFNKKYPMIKIEHLRVRAGDAATRIIAESRANAPTADVATTGLEILMDLDARGLLRRPNWSELGIAPELILTPYAFATTSVVICFSYNTDLVSEADAPKDWEDMLNPRWKGKIGIWQKPVALALMAMSWGEEKAIEYTKRLTNQKPVIYRSNFPLNNAVAAGEISVGITQYHTTLPTISKGAPIKAVFTDVTGYEPICSAIPVKSANPNAAKVLCSWLTSYEGATAYESASGRGTPLIKGTKTQKMLSGKRLSSFTPENLKDFARIQKEIENILMGR